MDAITVGRVAALDLADAANQTWLDRYAIDNLTFNALHERVRNANQRAACSFREGELIVWQHAAHDRYAVIGYHAACAAYYAIPRNAFPPPPDADR